MGLICLAVGPLAENTYLLYDDATREAFVVDPGGENERVIAAIEAQKLIVAAIVNTHGHVDHVVGVAALQAKYDVPFRVHAADRALVSQAKAHASYFGLRHSGEPRFGEDLEDGQELPLGQGTVRVIATPGHTPGGVCLLHGEDLLSGDTLFAQSVGRTDLEGGDARALMRSIREKLLTLPDATRVHPGHGPRTTIGAERRHNPFLR